MPRTVAEAAARTAAVLPAEHLAVLASFVQSQSSPGSTGEQTAAALVATPDFGGEVKRLWKAWRGEPSLGGLEVAAALRGAGAATSRLLARQRVDAVVTGPDSYAVPLKSTRKVLLEVIGSAKKQLWLTSFVAYPPDRLLEALQEALDRGVLIRLVLESESHDGGEWVVPKALGDLAGPLTIYEWPLEARAQADGNLPRMHAKVVVADRRIALITSANLTGAALDRNLEVGVLISGGDVPKRLADHLNRLRSSGEIKPLE